MDKRRYNQKKKSISKIMKGKATTYLEDLFKPKETNNQIELRDSIKNLVVHLPKTAAVTNNLLVIVARFFGITWPHLKE